MPTVIHKFPLTMTVFPQEVEELRGREYEVVHVGWDDRNATVALWVRYDPQHARLPGMLAPQVRVVATGEEVDARATYLGTVHHDSFVWHVFRLR